MSLKDSEYPWPRKNSSEVIYDEQHITYPTIPVTLDEGATCPTRGSVDSAGLDLYASEDTYIGQNATLVPTGVHMAIPKGHVGLIRSRSGMAYKKNVFSEAGVIDADYRGEIKVLLYCKKTETNWVNGHNTSKLLPSKPLVQKGERIAQLLIVPVNMSECRVVDSLDDTVRGEGGFGSTGN